MLLVEGIISRLGWSRCIIIISVRTTLFARVLVTSSGATCGGAGLDSSYVIPCHVVFGLGCIAFKGMMSNFRRLGWVRLGIRVHWLAG